MVRPFIFYHKVFFYHLLLTIQYISSIVFFSLIFIRILKFSFIKIKILIYMGNDGGLILKKRDLIIKKKKKI